MTKTYTMADLAAACDRIYWDDDTDCEYIGVRWQDVPYDGLGPIDHISHVWDDGDDTGIDLDGICAVRRDYLPDLRMGTYYGDHVAIIGGNDITYGEDPGEIVISDARVLEIIC